MKIKIGIPPEPVKTYTILRACKRYALTGVRHTLKSMYPSNRYTATRLLQAQTVFAVRRGEHARTWEDFKIAPLFYLDGLYYSQYTMQAVKQHVLSKWETYIQHWG